MNALATGIPRLIAIRERIRNDCETTEAWSRSSGDLWYGIMGCTLFSRALFSHGYILTSTPLALQDTLSVNKLFVNRSIHKILLHVWVARLLYP